MMFYKENIKMNDEELKEMIFTGLRYAVAGVVIIIFSLLTKNLFLRLLAGILLILLGIRLLKYTFFWWKKIMNDICED